MSALAERLRVRFFRDEDHPYQILEREVARRLRAGDTLLDAGCGFEAPLLAKFKGKAARLVGVDAVDFHARPDGVELHRGDLASMPLPDASVDLIVSRSVMEHLVDPLAVYREFRRVLRPGGHVLFLTGNAWDYGSIAARLIPNRFHPWIVARTEGRAEEDVFPTVYRSNTRRAVERWARASGLEIASFRYLGQYPSYFMFNGALFLIATAYEKLLSRFEFLRGLRGWIFVTLRKPSS
jgi:SAM-dependent methyltransferase